MTATSPLWALQVALFDRLSAVLGALSPAVPVYDDPPPDAPYPHVMIGEISAQDGGMIDGDLHDATVTLHVWSRYAGAKEARELLALIRAALHDQPLAVDLGPEWGVPLLHAEFETVFIEPDGRTRHGVMRFAVLIEEAD